MNSFSLSFFSFSASFFGYFLSFYLLNDLQKKICPAFLIRIFSWEGEKSIDEENENAKKCSET